MIPKDYSELEVFMAEAIEANQYKRPEIAARNLLSAMQAAGVVPVPVEATEGMCRAMAKTRHMKAYLRYCEEAGEAACKEPVDAGLVVLMAAHEGLLAAIAASPLRRKE